MNYKFFTLFVVILLAGCLGNGTQNQEICEEDNLTLYGWIDYHQWNTLPMSYGNSTIWQLNNSSMDTLFINISVKVYFSESLLVIEQGFFNLSIYQNDTLLWTNQTMEDMDWNLEVAVNVSEPIYLEIQSQGKDTHPESDYGDYFVMKTSGYTKAPTYCWLG